MNKLKRSETDRRPHNHGSNPRSGHRAQDASSEETDTTKTVLCQAAVRYFRRRIKQWFVTNMRQYPWRHVSDPYLLLIAEVVLQQTDAERAAYAYDQITRSYPTPCDLAAADPDAIASLFQPIGLFYRAKRIQECAAAIRDTFGGQVPASPADLMRLPGIGPYIAHAVCASAFRSRLAPVDVNVARILQRFFGLRSSHPRPRNDPLLWSAAWELLPPRSPAPAEWHWAVLDFAAKICTARSPRCIVCPVRRRCRSRSPRAAEA